MSTKFRGGVYGVPVFALEDDYCRKAESFNPSDLHDDMAHLAFDSMPVPPTEKVIDLKVSHCRDSRKDGQRIRREQTVEREIEREQRWRAREKAFLNAHSHPHEEKNQ